MSSSQYQKVRFYISQFTTLFFVVSLVILVKFYSAIGAVYARAAFEVVVYMISLIFVYAVMKKTATTDSITIS
jgi:O-antigen/teichoic acid export membrane protein